MNTTAENCANVVSRRQVLSECLIIFEARARSVSKDLAKLVALPGYEKQFALEEARCKCIREMMQDIEGGEELREKQTRLRLV